MLVSQVQNGMLVEPNRVYIIPPNTQMRLSKGVFELSPRNKVIGKYMPGNAFLTSLAADCGNRAIAVVLSGSNDDGTLGLTAIKAVGGFTFAQDKNTAIFNWMPLSAIATGHVDFVLPPEQIATELVAIGRKAGNTAFCGFMGYSYLQKPHSERGREFKVSSICLRTAVNRGT